MSDATAQQPGSGETGRFRRPHSLREPAPAAAKGGAAAAGGLAETLDGNHADAGASAAGPPPVAAEAAGAPLSAVLERLGLGQLDALIRRRPEVGLGIAFAGGLVAATILKRLGRR